jgi:hypothetical protein
MSGQFQLAAGVQMQLAAHTQSTGLDNSSILAPPGRPLIGMRVRIRVRLSAACRIGGAVVQICCGITPRGITPRGSDLSWRPGERRATYSLNAMRDLFRPARADHKG